MGKPDSPSLGRRSWFYPGCRGCISVASLRFDVIQKLAAKVKDGLFPRASSRRNRYEIVEQTDDTLHFRSANLRSGIHIGLNDVRICIDRSSGEIRYDIEFWTWAKFHVFLFFGITAILAFLALSHLIGLYLLPDFEYPSDFEIALYVIPSTVFWGFVWPWIHIYRHKSHAVKGLSSILKEVNPTESAIDRSAFEMVGTIQPFAIAVRSERSKWPVHY